MPWLAHLDVRARSWPRPAFWLYLLVKWYLVATGVVVAIGLAIEGNALGVGIVAAVASAVVSGLVTGLHARRSM